MASNTIYIPGGDIDEELETEILEIYTTGPNSSGMISLHKNIHNMLARNLKINS